MNWLGIIAITGTASIIGSVAFISIPAKAQTCVALPVVNGRGTQVQKKVSPPGTGITRDNWSTDFLVSSNQSFKRYVARITPKNGGEYNILMALKYNNDTADNVVNQKIQLAQGKAYTFQGGRRANATPYQVNVKVGGLKAVGNTYSVSVLGCY